MHYGKKHLIGHKIHLKINVSPYPLVDINPYMSFFSISYVLYFVCVLKSHYFSLRTAILSIVGNLLVLVMAYKRSTQMKPPELLSVNLAVTDLGAAITMYPLAVASAWNHHWIGGDVTCVYYGLMGFFFGAASMMTLTIMAVVRFVVSLTLQSPSEFLERFSFSV